MVELFPAPFSPMTPTIPEEHNKSFAAYLKSKKSLQETERHVLSNITPDSTGIFAIPLLLY